MNHSEEQGWQLLGDKLRHFDPGERGDPAGDFAALQALQTSARPVWWRVWWWVFPLLLVAFAGAGFLTLRGMDSLVAADPTNGTDMENAISTNDKSTEAIDASAIARGNTRSGSEASETVFSRSSDDLRSFASKRATQSTSGRSNGSQAVNAPTERLKDDVPTDPVSRMTGTKIYESDVTRDVAETPQLRAPAPERTAVPQAVATLPGIELVRNLSSHQASDVDPASLVATPTFTASPAAKTYFSLGTGLSAHVRQMNNLWDADQGFYVSLGLHHDVGRWTFGGLLGYRSYAPSFNALGGRQKPWTKFEHNQRVQAGGEDVTYSYTGEVVSYRALELSALVQYQATPRLGLQAGARYGLPSIVVRQNVATTPVTHHHNNPFLQFVDTDRVVSREDFSVQAGLDYRLCDVLRLEVQTNFGFVDLIDDTVAGSSRFDASNSLSIGLRYYIR